MVAPSEENYDDHFIHSVFEMLARLGVDPHTVKPGYVSEDGAGRIAIAFPDSKVGLSIEGDRPEPFIDGGWYVAKVPVNQLQAFALAFRAIGTMAFEHIRRLSMTGQMKTGSKEEERLLSALLTANVTEPDRNYALYRENGTELTTPDFVWEDIKLAFFMDGLWWHISKDDDRTLKMIAEASSDKDKGDLLMNSNRSRAERDGHNRSELSAMGWRVLSCTDKDLDTEKGVQIQVKRIVKTMRSIHEERATLMGLSITPEKKQNMLDLL